MLSCRNNQLNQPSKKNSLTNFTQEIFPKDSFWSKIKKRYDSFLNLASIEKGVDSFEFRFWIDPQLTNGDHVFCVKYQNNKWVFLNYYFDEHGDKSFELKDFNLVHYNIGEKPFFLCRSINPFAINFESFLSKAGVDTLPTQSSLKDYHGCCFDGTVYFFEIATKNSYKFCVYENPDCCKDNIEKNQQFLNFFY